MRPVSLKRVEIAGFKSFARRTILEFPPGITAIVGPNGSGKSNVAEALRWALGEQSSRIIRTRRMEEVIFAGGAARAAAERAEVVVVLATQNGELRIARRAHRSGEGDFWLNGRRARLRDISDALLHLTGATVSGASYAFIGQGMVERFLEMRPWERRQLIEDVADIARYKARIQESQSHLEAALEAKGRLEAIFRELQPRLQRLQSQARRAAQHARLSQELARALHHYYFALWHRGQAELSQARQQRAHAQQEANSLRERCETWRQELASLEKALQTRRQEAQRVAHRREEVAHRLHELEREVALAQQRLGDMGLRRQELAEEVASLNEELRALQVEAAAGDITQVMEALADARRREEEARRRLAEVEAQWREAEARRQAALERARGLRQQATEAQRRAAALREGAGQQAQRAEARRRELVGLLAQEVVALRTAHQEERRLQAALDELNMRMEVLRAEVEEARMQLQGEEARAAALRARLQEAQDLLAAIGGSVPGVRGVLGQVVRVPSGLEKAIASALGEAIRALLVDGAEEALQAALSLHHDSVARAIIAPLDGVTPPSPPSPPHGEKVLGLASQLVECEEGFRPVVEALLGHVLVVEDLDAARSLVGQRGLTVVTRDGLVLFPWGGIGVGSSPQGQRLISAHRTRQELEEAEEKAQKARRRLKAAQEALGHLLEEEKQLRAEARQWAQEAASRAQRMGRLRGELKAVMGTLARLRREDEAALKEVHRLQERASSLLQEARQAEEEAAAMASLVQGLVPARQSLLAQAVEAASRAAALEGELQNLRRGEERRRERLQKLSQALAAKTRQLQDLASQEQSLRASLAARQRELEECRRQLEALPPIAPILEEVSRLEAREKEVRSCLLAGQEKLVDVERALAHAQADEERWQRALEEAAARATEDGLPFPPPPPVDPQGDPEALEERVRELRERLRRLGQVDEDALTELQEIQGRYDYLQAQLADLRAGEAAVRRAQRELQEWSRQRFQEVFEAVAHEFSRFFQSFFPEGEARLYLVGGPEPGVELMARPPGKRVRSLAQLSGGERALTALAFLFALLAVNPFPFCVLDEADAMLDETNVVRFAEGLRRLCQRTQFIVISHNRRTIEAADAIYGISMGPDGVSRALSLSLAEALRA
jgi:chromosome segregation protein